MRYNNQHGGITFNGVRLRDIITYASLYIYRRNFVVDAINGADFWARRGFFDHHQKHLYIYFSLHSLHYQTCRTNRSGGGHLTKGQFIEWEAYYIEQLCGKSNL